MQCAGKETLRCLKMPVSVKSAEVQIALQTLAKIFMSNFLIRYNLFPKDFIASLKMSFVASFSFLYSFIHLLNKYILLGAKQCCKY